MLNKNTISAFVLVLNSFLLIASTDSLSIRYSAEIDSVSIKYFLSVLSSDSLLGRETGEEGQAKAEGFIVSEFKKNNISEGNNGSYLQEYKLTSTSLNAISLSYNDNIIDSQDQLLNYNLEKDTSIYASGIVFAGYGVSTKEYDDYAGLDVRDKVVFILTGNPSINDELLLSTEENERWNREYKLDFAKKLGAKALVMVNDNFDNYHKRLINYFKHGSLKIYENKNTEMPLLIMNISSFYKVFNFNEVDLNALSKQKMGGEKLKTIEKDGNVIVEVKTNNKISISSNIVAKIECSDSLAPWIVISAHYDHSGYDSLNVYNGADDNASGTSAVMEMARVFSKAKSKGVQFKKNFLFLLVSGEEKGLLGSKYYVANPVIDLSRTMVDLNADMIGRMDDEHTNSNYVYVIGADKISQQLHDINEEMNLKYTHLELDYTFNEDSDPNKFYYRSDHYNFALNGIPIIFYFNGTHSDYHKVTDTEDKILYNALTKRTELIFHTAWYLAMMEGALSQ